MELDDLISSINIVEYISQFMELEQRGDEWWGLSCFKDENTPSFSIRENPPVFYDYSSGIGGNVFTFTKEYYKCGSKKAVDILKSYVGIDGDLAVSKPKEKMVATMICKKFARPKQRKSKEEKGVVLADDYTDRYEINEDKLQIWKDEGISDESLRKFDVRYDGFSDRIVYPIRNMKGQIVNIGGRTLDENFKEKGLRKYCYFFNWGTLNTIYGLVENMEAILEKKEVILFEGCKSVLLADTWGIHNCGALLTSHLNPQQMKILARLGVRVVFALDNDVNILKDHNINILKKYVNVEAIIAPEGVLKEKDAPVDEGKEVFLELYKGRKKIR